MKKIFKEIMLVFRECPFPLALFLLMFVALNYKALIVHQQPS